MGHTVSRRYPSGAPTPAAVFAFFSLPDDGCIHWSGSTDVDGYGRFTKGGVHYKAHRFAWELFYGPIGDGLSIDHHCHNVAAEAGLCAGGRDCAHRRCVNVKHLRPLAPAENTKASPTSTASRRSTQTHCVNGHLLDEANTRRAKNRRTCRTCARAAQERFQSKRRSA